VLLSLPRNLPICPEASRKPIFLPLTGEVLISGGSGDFGRKVSEVPETLPKPFSSQNCPIQWDRFSFGKNGNQLSPEGILWFQRMKFLWSFNQSLSLKSFSGSSGRSLVPLVFSGSSGVLWHLTGIALTHIARRTGMGFCSAWVINAPLLLNPAGMTKLLLADFSHTSVENELLTHVRVPQMVPHLARVGSGPSWLVVIVYPAV